MYFLPPTRLFTLVYKHALCMFIAFHYYGSQHIEDSRFDLDSRLLQSHGGRRAIAIAIATNLKSIVLANPFRSTSHNYEENKGLHF